jgi:hypothetical protein
MTPNPPAPITVESWVEMTSDVPMRCQTDRIHEHASLYFGQSNEYVLTLSRENLTRMIELCTTAAAELDAMRIAEHQRQHLSSPAGRVRE